MRGAVWVLLCALSAGVAAAQTGAPLHFFWSPGVPPDGAFVYLMAYPDGDPAADPIVAVSGALGTEPLHFEGSGDGGFRALSGVPLGMNAGIMVQAVARRSSGREDTLAVSLPVTRAGYRLERLRVAPKFTEPPDSALQVWIAYEDSLAREVSVHTHTTPRQWFREFLLPRATRITSGYGGGRVYNGQVQSRHLGTDFAGAVGAPVQAANDGLVALIGDFYYSGRIVYLDHGEGLVTAYLHLSEVLVAVGDTVRRGQVIGRVGSSGRVTGPHLHWAARYGRSSLDPMSLAGLGLLVIPEPPPPVHPVAGTPSTRPASR